MAKLSGFDIVAFTYADWRASWSTPQQLMRRLVPENRVLFVDVPRSFLFGLKPKDPQGAGDWEGPRLQEVQENLHVYHPPHRFLPVGKLPFGLARYTLALNGQLLAGQLRRVMLQLGMVAPLLWNFSPLHAGAVPRIPQRLRIYDACDEWTNYIHDPAGRQLISTTEEQLVREADLVFVGTQNMARQRAGLNASIAVVHHAADYEHFATAAEPATPIPEDLARLPKPVVGYVGVMDDARFDVELVRALALARPAWSFALVGPVRAGVAVDRFAECKNVYLLGNRPIAALPGYLKGIDAAIIPYLVNDATRNIYLLKLHEYLASGKPVVSAPLPSILPFAEVVAFAPDAEAFLARIEEALTQGGVGSPGERRAVAAANRWEDRLAQKAEHVLAALARGRRPEGAA